MITPMKLQDFLRLYPLRSPQIAWLLGAGASAAAGVPTAFSMVQDFKRTLYCAAQGVSVRECSDLGDPSLQATFRRFFEAAGGFPPENSEDEYAALFEAAYPDEADRRRYIEAAVASASPSYGHRVLAGLLQMSHARIVFTTNFDRMVEDAAFATLGGSGGLVVASLDSPQRALEAMNEGRWPLLVKLHGDFHSRRLKNTTAELRAQDEQLRYALVEACKRYGLAVIGYSGRDQSIMDALEEAVAGGKGYPSGLFWFQRAGTPCLPRVARLMEMAAESGIGAHVIETESFDELTGDVLNLIQDIPEEVVKQIGSRVKRLSEAPIPVHGQSWPILRLNALPVVSWPTIARRVVCEIGGAREVREAVRKGGTPVLAARRSVGVIAFGSDADVRKTFEGFGISQFDVHSIEAPRFRYESAELGLLYEALAQGLARQYPLQVQRRGPSFMAAIDPGRASDPVFAPLRRAISPISGCVPKTRVRWSEAFRFRLEYRLGTLWLLLMPTVWIERGVAPDEAVETAENDPEGDDAEAQSDELAREFVRSRLAGRYNKAWNYVLDGWAAILAGEAKDARREIRAFGIGDGIDAVFTISRVTGFSRKGVSR